MERRSNGDPQSFRIREFPDFGVTSVNYDLLSRVCWPVPRLRHETQGENSVETRTEPIKLSTIFRRNGIAYILSGECR